MSDRVSEDYQMRRVMEFFGWDEPESRNLLDAMLDRVGGLEILSSFSPAQFASCASRTASRADRGFDCHEETPLPDRVDELVRMLDGVSTSRSASRRLSLAVSSEHFAANLAAGRPAPVALIRRDVAFVPVVEEGGSTRYRRYPVRNLDVEEMDRFHERMIRAAAKAMASAPLGFGDVADLVEGIMVTTDATDREAADVADLLSSCDHQEAPRDLTEFAELVASLLMSIRGPGRLRIGIARQDDDASARVGGPAA